jgi:5'-phosphate synthase pdxT subunit
MNIEVARNAYGRQSGSFRTTGPMEQVGDMVPMTFIRAPYIMRPTTPDVQVLARVDGRIVAARQHHLLVTAFHPELDDDLRIHRLFLDIVRHNSKQCPAQQQAKSGTTASNVRRYSKQ